MNKLQNEWNILHQDIEKYARFSLLIKLFSVLVCLLAFTYQLSAWLAILFILILWLQNGIWQTFQARLEKRILFIEQQIQSSTNSDDMAFQLYSQFQEQRLGAVGLVKEYCINSLKPTIAYPFVLLVVVVGGYGLFM
ncbi:MAG: hypothetical protein methR_P0407 [Methyloprofundus sp.]|nr:MAG: hypothetical protein methR_P0407 [Methyloprofundus sp.]